jgi:hypothetical protein
MNNNYPVLYSTRFSNLKAVSSYTNTRLSVYSPLALRVVPEYRD